MLELRYTGANTPQAAQTVGSASIGGYISSSLVPNDVLGVLFPELSQMSKENLSRNTKIIALKNITGATLTAFTVYTTTDADADSTFKLGYQVPTIDDCGDITSEKLPNSGSLPQLTTLADAELVGNALALPDLTAGGYLFLFVSRTIVNGIQTYTKEQLITQETVPLPKEETSILTFTYT